jgi:hypothetical protein
LNGFSFVEFVVLVENDIDVDGGAGAGLFVESAVLNFGTFGKVGLVGVVVIVGNRFVSVVCGGGTGADVEN